MKGDFKSEMKFSFSRSSGAGGQNVNKVNSKATLSWNISRSEFYSNALKNRFMERFPSDVYGENVIIVSQKHRAQGLNIEDCIEKLSSMLLVVKSPPKIRKQTKPTKSSIKKRLDSKNKNSTKKKLRSEKF